MKSLNLITLQQKQADVMCIVPGRITELTKSIEQLRDLVDLVRLYRSQEEAYLKKVRMKVFAKDELHHMMQTRQKLDYMLSSINF